MLSRAAGPPAAAYLQLDSRGGAVIVRFRDRWVIDNIQALEEALDAAAARVTESAIQLDAQGVSDLDLTGAALIHRFAESQSQRGGRVEWRGRVPEQLALVEKALAGKSGTESEMEAGVDDLIEPVRSVGRWSVGQWQALRQGLAFFGRICTVIVRAFRHVRHLRLTALVRHVYETGIQAVPIVSLIAFLISVIVAYMGAQQLRRFGAEIFVVDLVTVGVLREMGVLLTAIIVAGRSGSAFAAEIGVMQLNEEVDALKAIGTDPVEVLVLPRVLGLVIALPLLTIIADAVGLAGGGLLCFWLLDIPLAQYLSRLHDAISPTTFWVGVIKAPVFAFLIAYVGTLRGMQVRESSRELGRLTTVAVVQSIFLVILADAVFAVIFLELDI